MKKTTRYFLFLFFIALVLGTSAQLPYTGGNICLDKMQSVSGSVNHKPSRNFVVKDFDGNALKDVLIADVATGKLVLYVQGITGFTATLNMNIPGLGTFNSIDAADFDSDGKLDIVMCYGGNIKLFKGGPSYTYTLVNTIPMMSNHQTTPSYIRAEDLNGDLRPDLLLTGSHVNPNHGVAVFAYRNTNNITPFSFNLDYNNLLFYGSPTLDSSRIIDVSPGDIDGLNGKDLFYTYSAKQDSMMILQSTGTSSLSFNLIRRPIISSTGGEFGNYCETGDLDGDGIFDLVATSMGAGNIQANLFFGNAAATVSLTQTFNLPGPILDFKLIDINTDSHPDFVGLNSSKLYIHRYDVFNNQFDPTAITITLSTTYSAAEMQVTDYDFNFFNDLIIKTSDGTSGIPYIIPNFAHYAQATTPNTLICSGQSATLNAASSVTFTSLSHSFSWYVFGNPNSYTTGLSAVTATPGTHYVILSHSVPFTSGFTCNFLGLPTVITQAPDPVISVAQNKPAYCLNEFAYLQAGGASTYTWYPHFAAGSSTSVQVTAQQTYTVMAADTNGCKGSNTISVSFHPPFQNEINLSKSPVCPNETVTIHLPGASSYSWSAQSPNAPQIQLTPAASSVISVNFEDMNGCAGSRTILVTVNPECELKVYSSITPNGDNKNDFWYLENIERYKDNRVTIYDRWGSTLFDQRGYDNVKVFWPGNNNHVNPGTYYYVISLGDGTVKKGWLEIVN